MKLLVFSDIHGDQAALERLMNLEADYYFAAGDLANFGNGLDRLGPVLHRRAERTYVVPGNHESASEIEQFCKQFGLHNFHGKSLSLEGHTVSGLGYSITTPFQTPGEYTEAEMEERLNALTPPEILICHSPPKNTKLDRAGAAQHYGSRAIREYIEKHQPQFFYCGHIHEAAGQSDRIGNTAGFNVGKQGRILEL